MRSCTSGQWLLWGCVGAVLLWLTMVWTLSARVVDQAADSQPADQMAAVLSRLESALQEVRDLKKENSVLKSPTKTPKRKNGGIVDMILTQTERLGVLRRPLEKVGPAEGLYSKHHEVARRALDNSIRELFLYLHDQVRQHEGNADFAQFGYHVLNQTISLMADSANFGTLVDGAAQWRRLELQKLTDRIQQKIFDLQHPEDCSKAQILVCDLNKGCGFGCQLHHVGYCMMVAAASNRTVVLERDGDGWRYSQHGWTAVFEPISGCSYSAAVPRSTSVETYRSNSQTDRVVFLTIIEAIASRPEQLPLSFPKQMADEILRLHSAPPVYFASQFIWYLMRSNAHMQEVLDKSSAKIPFGEGPIVGLQIRRTDKIGTEAAFHSVDEYMRWAELWFETQERRHSPRRKIKRRVYIATDDPAAVKETKEKYPKYEVYADVGIAQSAQVANRYTDVSLYGVITDVRLLSKCDYLVCTFSSQVCRVGYELMQVEKGDAGEWFHSLDDVYYYGGQHAHEQVIVENHKAETSAEMDAEVGDIVGIAGNHWDGYSKGTNRRTGSVGLYPSYKAREQWRLVDFPIFA